MAADWLGRNLFGSVASQGTNSGNGTSIGGGDYPNGRTNETGTSTGQQARQQLQNKTYARIQEYRYTPPLQKNSILLIVIVLIVLLIIL